MMSSRAIGRLGLGGNKFISYMLLLTVCVEAQDAVYAPKFPAGSVRTIWRGDVAINQGNVAAHVVTEARLTWRDLLIKPDDTSSMSR